MLFCVVCACDIWRKLDLLGPHLGAFCALYLVLWKKTAIFSSLAMRTKRIPRRTTINMHACPRYRWPDRQTDRQTNMYIHTETDTRPISLCLVAFGQLTKVPSKINRICKEHVHLMR